MPLRPFNFHQWVEEHRHLLRPPVGNKQVFLRNDDFIVMVVGGPNARKDYHYDESEELFYQIEGDIVLRIIEDGKPVEIPIRQGEVFLLPPRVPHSPQRPSNTIGLVIERYRSKEEKDGCLWFCEQCHNKLHEIYFDLGNIETQLPIVMKEFYDSLDLRTCQACGAVMEPPMKKSE